MKQRSRSFAMLICAMIVCATTMPSLFAQAGSGNSPLTEKWVGVWQGQLEGIPGVVLTLGDDLGEVSGTIVFTAIRDGHVAGHATHAILHPHVDSNTLFFKVKRPGDPSVILEMSMVLADAGNGQLICVKCDGVSPIALVKLD